MLASAARTNRQGKWVAHGLILLVLVAFAAGCQSENDSRILKVAHALGPSHPVHQSIEHLDERLQEKSAGSMRLDIYPSAQLGSERQLLELLQAGSLDIVKVSSAVMEGFVPEYKVFGLPYLFRNDDHRYAVMEGPIGRHILEASRDVALRGLTFYDAGTRSFYTGERPVRTPDDLRGLKIRTMNSPVSIRMVNQMGGAATPIAFGELYTALQQGVVDGAENNLPSFYLTNHYELCSYYSLDEHTAPQDVLLTSSRLWSRLSDQQRTWLQEAATESAAYQKTLWQEARAEALQAVRKAGVAIVRPDKSRFIEAAQPVYRYYQEHEPRVYELYQRISELGNQWKE